jgi:hypothetical protein
MTSCLVRPLTLSRLRLPLGPKPLQRTPRQRHPATPVVSAVDAARALVIEDDAVMAPGHPSPIREHAPVVPGGGYRSSDQRFKKAI